MELLFAVDAEISCFRFLLSEIVCESALRMTPTILFLVIHIVFFSLVHEFIADIEMPAPAQWHEHSIHTIDIMWLIDWISVKFLFFYFSFPSSNSYAMHINIHFICAAFVRLCSSYVRCIFLCYVLRPCVSLNHQHPRAALRALELTVCVSTMHKCINKYFMQIRVSAGTGGMVILNVAGMRQNPVIFFSIFHSRPFTHWDFTCANGWLQAVVTSTSRQQQHQQRRG